MHFFFKLININEASIWATHIACFRMTFDIRKQKNKRTQKTEPLHNSQHPNILHTFVGESCHNEQLMMIASHLGLERFIKGPVCNI